jgi:hypothetical protein
MELRMHKSDGHISIEKHALIGITFYEIFRQGDEGRLRAHFIKSIYDLAWRNFDSHFDKRSAPAPTGLCPKAQGCEARATLGHRPQIISNRNAVAAISVRPSRATSATTALRLMICLNDDPR